MTSRLLRIYSAGNQWTKEKKSWYRRFWMRWIGTTVEYMRLLYDSNVSSRNFIQLGECYCIHWVFVFFSMRSVLIPFPLWVKIFASYRIRDDKKWTVCSSSSTSPYNATANDIFYYQSTAWRKINECNRSQSDAVMIVSVWHAVWAAHCLVFLLIKRGPMESNYVVASRHTQFVYFIYQRRSVRCIENTYWNSLLAPPMH